MVEGFGFEIFLSIIYVNNLYEDLLRVQFELNDSIRKSFTLR